jgi:hypothetical protein
MSVVASVTLCVQCGKQVKGYARRGLCAACDARNRRKASKDRMITCHVCGRKAKFVGYLDQCSACYHRRTYVPRPRKELPKVVMTDEVRDRFTREILPKVRSSAGWKYRHRRDCEDLVAEAVAMAWARMCREVRLGRDPFAHVNAVIVTSVRYVVRDRLCGEDRVNDVLSPRAKVGLEEIFGEDVDGNLLEKFGVPHDWTWVLDSGGMSASELAELL